MYPKANFISRNADLFRGLCRLPLARYEQSMIQQLDSAETLFIRHCQNVRTGLSRSTALSDQGSSRETGRGALPESSKAPPALVTSSPAESPMPTQAAAEATSFPDALTGLVARHAQQRTQAKRSRAPRAA